MPLFSSAILILEFLAMLSFLVIIHELGHFITARFFKVKIEEFGLGYPPKVKKLFSWKGIPFTLNLFPIGGFVRMEGEASPSDPGPTNTAFYSKPKYARLIVILAGASVNFLFGVLAFTVIYSRIGIPTLSSSPQTIVAEVGEGPGRDAGLLAGDQIISAKDSEGNEIQAKSVTEFTNWIRTKADSQVVLKIKRGEVTEDLVVHTRQASEIMELGAISVMLAEPVEAKFYPWYRMPFEASKFGLMRSLELTKLILQSLGRMGTDLFQQGKLPSDIAGPIGIVSEVGKQKVFSSGFLRALDFTAMFSINLAIMNILPIPALDGGRAIFILLEFILGKRRVAKIEERSHSIGLVVLLFIILAISVKDVWMLVRSPY